MTDELISLLVDIELVPFIFWNLNLGICCLSMLRSSFGPIGRFAKWWYWIEPVKKKTILAKKSDTWFPYLMVWINEMSSLFLHSRILFTSMLILQGVFHSASMILFIVSESVSTINGSRCWFTQYLISFLIALASAYRLVDLGIMFSEA